MIPTQTDMKHLFSIIFALNLAFPSYAEEEFKWCLYHFNFNAPMQKNRDAVSRVSIRIYNGKINYLTSQVSLVSRSSAKLWYFLAALTSSICALTASS